MPWASAPAISLNWKKVRAASFCGPGASTIPASGHCATRFHPDTRRSTSKPSGNRAMIRRYGIDTSVLVRLLTGDPEKDFQYCVSRLRTLIDEQGSEIFASNQVVGEAYVAVQYHYGVAKAAARDSLRDVLRSGLVSPLNGPSVVEALETLGGAGLLDRLIADDYSRAGMEVLTLDRKMAVLSDVRRL